MTIYKRTVSIGPCLSCQRYSMQYADINIATVKT